MNLPKHRKYVVIGGGIHGISSAFYLARTLRAKGMGSGADVVLLDKRGIGSGASGIACGVVRNNYFQPAMRELMALRGLSAMAQAEGVQIIADTEVTGLHEDASGSLTGVGIAQAVPILPLRGGQTASGLEQPIPLELALL